MTDQVITGELRNWKLLPVGENNKKVILGDIYGDVRGRFIDGTCIYTSAVLKIEDGIAHTQNSTYRLEEEVE